jgi:hypothetical protein
MKTMLPPCLCLLALWAVAPAGPAPVPASDLKADASKPGASAPAKGSTGKTVRLLTVGNSFSQNATRYLKDLAAARGHVLIHQPAVVGGASMALHWDKVEQHRKDPQDRRGLYGTKGGLKEMLAAEPWDFVTIQQASIRSHDVATYRPYAGQLVAFIKKHAPRAEVLIHQTWAYRRDDPRFRVAAPRPGEPATQEAMYQGLTIAYMTIALELGLRRIPVGDAFHLADTDPTWGYRPDATFDPRAAKYPALPDQTHSLHVGWSWKKQKDGTYALQMDGHHANVAGEYLGGCVFYEVLFGESVVGNPFRPPALDAAYARFLQETAHRAVAGVQARKAG